MKTSFGMAASAAMVTDIIRQHSLHERETFRILRETLEALFQCPAMENYRLDDATMANFNSDIAFRNLAQPARENIHYLSIGYNGDARVYSQAMDNIGNEAIYFSVAGLEPQAAAAAILLKLAKLDPDFATALYQAMEGEKIHYFASPDGKRLDLHVEDGPG